MPAPAPCATTYNHCAPAGTSAIELATWIRERRPGLRRFRLLQGSRQVRAVQSQGRDHGDWRDRQGLFGHQQQLGVHRRWPRARLPSRSRSHGHGADHAQPAPRPHGGGRDAACGVRLPGGERPRGLADPHQGGGRGVQAGARGAGREEVVSIEAGPEAVRRPPAAAASPAARRATTPATVRATPAESPWRPPAGPLLSGSSTAVVVKGASLSSPTGADVVVVAELSGAAASGSGEAFPSPGVGSNGTQPIPSKRTSGQARASEARRRCRR